MSQSKAENGLSKFQRYRRARNANGMKLLRIWVPDPSAAGFQTEVRRQAALLRGVPEEAEALRFIKAAAHWPER